MAAPIRASRANRSISACGGCKAAGKTCDFVVYPDAPHGFNADYRPSYRRDAAKDGWARMLAWFKDHGVG